MCHRADSSDGPASDSSHLLYSDEPREDKKEREDGWRVCRSVEEAGLEEWRVEEEEE